MEIEKIFNGFYNGKKVLVTGSTGFKGTWLCKILSMMGAQVVGYALKPISNPSLYELSGIEKSIKSVMGDIRDFNQLYKVFMDEKPEVVFHLAAQPIVRESYCNPRYTYEVNVMGTVNLLECVRLCPSVKSVLNVTTDKVYRNNEWEWGYRENDVLDGFDPYSNSKSCSELVTATYIRSFTDRTVAISTARAGNVIGGGDFSKDRIIPDCIKAVLKREDIIIRNPNSIRPYQHVLEPLYSYLMIAARQTENPKYIGSYNIGPNESDCVTTGELADMFCESWGNGATWKCVSEIDAPHEAGYLRLDCSKVKNVFDWRSKWDICEAIEKTCEFTQRWKNGEDVSHIMQDQISRFYEVVS